MGKVVRGVLKIASIAVAFVPGIGPLAKAAITIGLSVLDRALAPKVPKVSPAQRDRLFSQIDPSAFRKTVLGSTAMANDVRYEEWSGPDQEYLDRITCVASHKVHAIREIWFEDKLAWTSTGGVTSTYAGYLDVQTVLEGNAGNTISINGGAKWGANQRLTGCAYVHTRFKRTGNSKKAESPFATAIPQRVTIIGDGALLYDPRLDSTVGGSGSQRADDQSTWAWTSDTAGNNAALHILFRLLGWRINGLLAVGAGIPVQRFLMSAFIAAANMCEEPVALSAQSGGGTEPRYLSAGVISEGDPPEQTLETLTSSCAGTLRDASGFLALHILHNDLAVPVASFTDTDVLGEFSWQKERGLDESFNLVRGRRTDPSPNSLYQLVDYPAVSLPSPDGLERPHPFDLSMVQSASQAQRLAKQELQRAQFQGVFKADFKMTALRAQVGDVVDFIFSPLAFAGKLFRVTEQVIRMDGRITMTFREEDPAIYAWSQEESPAVVAAPPSVYDPLNSPLIKGIADAGEPTNSADNLLFNGDLELADGRNFEVTGGATYRDDDHVSFIGRHLETASTATILSDALIRVDTGYALEGDVRIGADHSGGRAYAGIACYDKDGQPILPFECYFYANTLTNVYEAAVAGATELKIVPAGDWSLSSLYVQMDAELDGSHLPSRNRHLINSIDTSNPSYILLSLDTPLAAAVTTATQVAASRSGSTYNYFLALNAPVTQNAVDRHTGIIGPGVNGINEFPSANKFRIGTKFVRWMALSNRGVAGTMRFLPGSLRRVGGKLETIQEGADVTADNNALGFYGEGVLARLDNADALLHLINAGALTGGDVLDTNNLFFNGDFSLVNVDASPIRPLGVRAVASTTLFTDQPRYPGNDHTTREMQLGLGTNAGIRAYFPFWRCNPKSLYIARFEARSEVDVSAGHYARFMELDTEPAVGATHMGYPPAHADPIIAEATRERIVGGSGSIENDALTTAWQEFTIQMNPSATALYMGLELLRWGSVNPAATAFRWRNLRITEVTPSTLALLDADQDGKLSGIEIAADVTANKQVVITPPSAQVVYRDYMGAPKTNQFNRTLVPIVKRGGTDIRTHDDCSYSIATNNVEATINDSAGHADKGKITVTDGGIGSIALTITVDGTVHGPFYVPFTVQDDPAPLPSGPSGSKSASDSTLASVNSHTAEIVMTSTHSGEDTFLIDVAAGETLSASAPLSYQNYSDVNCALKAKWQYKPDGGSWTDFANWLNGTNSSSFFEPHFGVDIELPGSIQATQSKTGLAAGMYEVRLVGQNTVAGQELFHLTGTANVQSS